MKELIDVTWIGFLHSCQFSYFASDSHQRMPCQSYCGYCSRCLQWSPAHPLSRGICDWASKVFDGVKAVVADLHDFLLIVFSISEVSFQEINIISFLETGRAQQNRHILDVLGDVGGRHIFVRKDAQADFSWFGVDIWVLDFGDEFHCQRLIWVVCEIVDLKEEHVFLVHGVERASQIAHAFLFLKEN